MAVAIFHDQSPRRYGNGPVSNFRPLNLQSDLLPPAIIINADFQIKGFFLYLS